MARFPQIATKIIIAGKPYLVAKTTKETREIMHLLDDEFAPVDKKLSTGVLDVPVKTIAGLGLKRHQARLALTAMAKTEPGYATFEFLPA